MSFRGVIATVGCLAMILGAALVNSRAAVADKKQPTKLELELDGARYARLHWAERARDAQAAAYESGTVQLGTLIDAANARIEAELATCNTMVQRLAALEKHLEFLEQQREKIDALYKTGSRGGEANSQATISRECEAARVRLLEERIAAEATAK